MFVRVNLLGTLIGADLCCIIICMYISVDIGGTSTRIGVVSSAKKILQVITLPTHQDFSLSATQLITTLNHLQQKYPNLQGVVLGVPGVMAESGQIVAASNLVGWEGQNLKQIISTSVHIPVAAINDVELSCLGEAVTQTQVHDFVFLIWGTGFGGTRLECVKKNYFHLKGIEIGYLLSDWPKQAISSYRDPAYIETYLGGGALSEKYGPLAEISDHDPLWQEAARYAALAIHNVAWSVELFDFIFAGGVITKRPWLLESITQHLKHIWYGSADRFPTLCLSANHDDSALYGALGYYTLDTNLRK